MYAPNPVNTLKEMARVLKNGGHCIAAVWGKRNNCGWADIFEIVDIRVSSDVCPMFFNLGKDNVLEKSFELAEFSTEKIKRLQTFLDYTTEAASSAAFEGGAVASAYFKFPENVRKEASPEYLASIEKYKTEKGYAVTAALPALSFAAGTDTKQISGLNCRKVPILKTTRLMRFG